MLNILIGTGIGIISTCLGINIYDYLSHRKQEKERNRLREIEANRLLESQRIQEEAYNRIRGLYSNEVERSTNIYSTEPLRVIVTLKDRHANYIRQKNMTEFLLDTGYPVRGSLAGGINVVQNRR